MRRLKSQHLKPLRVSSVESKTVGNLGATNDMTVNVNAVLNKLTRMESKMDRLSKWCQSDTQWNRKY